MQLKKSQEFENMSKFKNSKNQIFNNITTLLKTKKSG